MRPPWRPQCVIGGRFETGVATYSLQAASTSSREAPGCASWKARVKALYSNWSPTARGRSRVALQWSARSPNVAPSALLRKSRMCPSKRNDGPTCSTIQARSTASMRWPGGIGRSGLMSESAIFGPDDDRREDATASKGSPLRWASKRSATSCLLPLRETPIRRAMEFNCSRVQYQSAMSSGRSTSSTSGCRTREVKHAQQRQGMGWRLGDSNP